MMFTLLPRLLSANCQYAFGLAVRFVLSLVERGIWLIASKPIISNGISDSIQFGLNLDHFTSKSGTCRHRLTPT